MGLLVSGVSLSGLLVTLMTTPWWNYLLQVLLAGATVLSLYLNFILDPGVIMPSFTIDPLVL